MGQGSGTTLTHLVFWWKMMFTFPESLLCALDYFHIQSNRSGKANGRRNCAGLKEMNAGGATLKVEPSAAAS